MRVDRNEQGVELGAHWGEKFFFEFSSKKCRVLCISIAKNYTCGQKPNLGALIDPTGGRRCKMNVSWKFSTTRQLAPWLKMCYITSISLVKLISWWESSSKWMWNVCCNLLNVVYAVTWMRTDGNTIIMQCILVQSHFVSTLYAASLYCMLNMIVFLLI